MEHTAVSIRPANLNRKKTQVVPKAHAMRRDTPNEVSHLETQSGQGRYCWIALRGRPSIRNVDSQRVRGDGVLLG